MMNAYEIAFLLKKLGVRETKAETYPNTYSLVNGASFLAQQVNNRDSASWKKAEYIILTDASVSQGILEGWKKLTERDPLPSAIQKLCVPASHDKFDVYDSQGKLIGSNSLDKIIKHTPDIVDFLNNKEPLIYPKNSLNPPSFTPSQIIYYGVPGCGKSKKVQDTIANVEEYNKVRVVFHPEYSSADFIGQIFPCVCEDGHGVDYRFKAGPFSEILRRAYLNPQQQFYLVIEEINRGNAAAIFSDVFQLLDRLKKGYSDSVGGNTYTAGWSQYFVDNADINGYIRKESAFLNEISDENRELIHRGVAPSSDKDSAKCYKSIKITDCNGCEINFTANTAIRLPPNLSILATMNTSDQNVFTLDNAFKRRFDSELIKNTLAGDEHKVQRETKIEGTSVTWGEFWEKINNLILEKNASMTSTEDKRLGAYFIVGDEKTDAAGNKYREVSKKLFGEKVLEYLWNDAFKFKHKDIFKEDCKSVESLIENFEEGGFAAVFKNDEFTAAAVQELKASDN